jgi:hypothetical protein
MITRRTALASLLSLPALTLPARAASPMVFQTDGVAINGADPVAYATDARPVVGAATMAVSWRGAEWRFASAANRTAFEADPERFAPRFGGYCAYAASKGYLAPTVPEAWTIWEGRLYLNANLRARELWLQDIPGNVAKAEQNWPGILG